MKMVEGRNASLNHLPSDLNLIRRPVTRPAFYIMLYVCHLDNRLGKALRGSVDADEAGVKVHLSIFARTALCVVRSPEITGVLGHEAPVALKDDRGQFRVLAPQQVKIAQVAGLVAALPRQSGQFNAQALID